MEKINKFIIERLHINKDIGKNKSSHDKIMYDNVCSYLCKWLYATDTYKGRKNNRIEFLKEVDNKLIDLFELFPNELEDMSERLQMPIRNLMTFIEDNNDKLIEDGKEYYQEMYNKLSF